MLLNILNLKRSTYYYENKALQIKTEDQELMEEIKEIYDKNKKRYGYRRIAMELRNKNYKVNGEYVNHKKVQRLMQLMNLKGISPKVKYKSYKGDMNGTVKNALLDKEYTDQENNTYKLVRNFSTTDLNQKWTTDVSVFIRKWGRLYLSPILDMHNHEIVSFNISRSPNYAQIQDMLDKAFSKGYDLEGLIFHSDQGWQYQMTQYHKALKDHGIIQSMSRKGNCLDNCVMENFFGKMKNEMFYGHEDEFESLEDLQRQMEEYIIYYNEERIITKLKVLTPLQIRNQTL